MKTLHSVGHRVAQSWLARSIASAFLPQRGSAPGAGRRAGGYALEMLEPRLLLSADISYAYSAADAAKFGLDTTNEYRLLFEDGAGGDVVKLLAENDDVLASATLANDGVNKITLTGHAGLTDQLTVDFSGFAGADGTPYAIEIDMDGKGDAVLPADEKIEFIGDGGYTLDSLIVQAHEQVVVTGDVVAQGDIAITTSASDSEGLPGVDGLLFMADTGITMSDAGARLQSNTGSVSLLAQATLTIATSDFSPGDVNIAFAIGIAGAQIDISGGTISAATNLSVEAKSTVHSTLSTVPDDASDDDDQVDAAVASAIVTSSPTVTISGGTLSAGGTASVKATNTVTVASTADGLTGDQGGTVAFNLLMGDTGVSVTGGSLTAHSVSLQATSDRTSTATAKATVGGANDSGSDANESEKRLDDPNKDGSTADRAKTDEGSIGFAAAVAVAIVTGDTTASITGGSVVASAGNLDLSASGEVQVTTTADGSSKTGGDGTSVGAAVAINVVTPAVTATLGGGSVDSTGFIHVKAQVPLGVVEATATSGAGGSNLGVAGSLALNVAVLDADAVISGNVAANGADISVSANSNTQTKAVAKAKVDGSGDATGVGASVAIDIADGDTHARLAGGAVLGGADFVSFEAVSEHKMVTEAKGGATGGTAVTPVVAVSIANHDTRSSLGTGGTLTVTSGLELDAKDTGSVDTLADGEAAGSSAAVGAAIGFTYSHATAVATTLRDVVATGPVAFTSTAIGQNTTRAKASASGASDTGQDAQQQGDSKRTAGNQRAANSGASGSGTDKKAEAETPGDSSGSGNGIAVAAAIAIDIVDSASRAEIGDGRSITSGGALTVRSKANIDGSATADGTAVDAGSAGVGAAVAVNSVDVDNTAKIGASSISADGVTVEALMVDRKVNLAMREIPIVDVDHETIFLGMGHGLATGQEVEYDSGGGTAVGGLTSGNTYYVRDVGHGQVELYDTKAHAQDSDSHDGRADLTSSGSGDNHKLDLPFPAGEVKFDPNPNSLRVIKLDDHSGMQTGDEVVYHADTGAPIGGLTDGGTYYVIMIDDEKAQLAASRDDALAGKAIVLTSDASGADDFLTEATHKVSAQATSGAGADDVGVAGSVAVNRGEAITIARNGGNLTLVDGPDAGGGAGAVTVRAQATTQNVARALPEGDGAVAGSVGVGASFALNLVLHDTTAEIGSGSWSGSAASITVDADARHLSDTEARNGAKGSTGVGAAVAILISESDTKADIATGGTLTTAGAASITADHMHTVSTKVSSEAAGSSASVGASVGVNYLHDTNLAQVARSVTSTGGGVALGATLTLTSTLDVHASAAGGDSSGDDADTEAGKKTNNTSTAGGGRSNPSADSSADSANGDASSESGSQASGVGVAAAISINAVVVSNSALVTNGADLSGTGAVNVDAQVSLDAKSQADATSVNLDGDVNVGAAVALNYVDLDNTGRVNAGSVLAGSAVRVEAVTTGSERNDYVATAYTAAGNRGGSASVAGAIAINVVDADSQAILADGSAAHATGNVDVLAEHDMGLQAAAASGAFSSDAGVGAAVAINVVGTGTGGSRTIASVGEADGDDSGAEVQAGGTVTVAASHKLHMTGVLDLAPAINDAGIADPSVDIGSLAVAGAAASGGSGIAGSAAIDVFSTSTQARVERASTVEGVGGGTAKAGALTVSATDTTSWNSVAGSIAIGLDGAGVGAGLNLAIFDKDTRAAIGRGATVDASGAVSLSATNTETLLAIAGNAGIGGSSAGIAGSASVQVMTLGARAYVEDTGGASAASLSAGGSLAIAAHDTFVDKLIGASLGVGSSVGVGAANATLVLHDTVQAWVGAGATASSTGGNVSIEATNHAELLGITATAGVAGTVAVGGSVTVAAMTQTTEAWVGRGATSSAGGDMLVHADADTIVTDVAGSLSASGTAAVGVGVDAGVLTKTTRAFIDSGASSTVGGNLRVVAESSEDVTSIVAGFAASGGASVSANPSITVFDLTTKAHIGDDPDAGPAALTTGAVVVQGSILISADDRTEIDKVSAGAAAGVVGVGLAANVTYIDKTTAAFIGSEATVTAQGNGSGVDASLGVLTPATAGATPGTGTVEANSAGTYNGSASSVGASAEVGAPSIGNSGSDESTDGAESSVEVNRSLVRGSTNVHGIAISATNSDDLETYSLAIGAGSVGVAVSGSVNIVNTNTRAFIGANASVNEDLTGSNAAQSVRIGAGNDLHHVAITASAAGGFVGVAPGVDVTVTDTHVQSEIQDGAVVKARDDVTVDAGNAADAVVVTIGAAGGFVGIGAGVSVLSITDETTARIGAATVSAGDSVGVRADDQTDFVLVDGSAGGGFVGVGAGVGVVVIGKSTHALIDNGATVDGAGAGSGLGGTMAGTLTNGDAADGFDRTTARGVVVQATSREDLLHVAVAAGGGAVGVAGAVAVTVIDSDTLAEIGNADVNKNTTGSGQDVYVNAGNEVRVQTIVGALGAGIVGGSGAVDIGAIRNDVGAKIHNGADVRAGRDVEVNALAIKDLDGFTASASGGAVGLGAAVSVWGIGTPIQQTYDGQNPAEKGGVTAQDEAGSNSVNALDHSTAMWSGYGSVPADDSNPANRSRTETASSMTDALSGINGSNRPTSGSVASLVNSGAATQGTQAVIENGAAVTAGTSPFATGSIRVTAKADVEVDMLIGQLAIGLVGAGAAVGVETIQEAVLASAGGTLSADGQVAVSADMDTDLHFTSVAGQGGLVGVGASVVVLTDSSTVKAEIADGATVNSASSVQVNATTHRDLTVSNTGVNVSGVAVGASFSDIDIAGSVTARVGHNAQLGQGSGTVGSLAVSATANETATIETFALAAGVAGGTANFADLRIHPTVLAEVGNGALITVGGNASIDAGGQMDGSSTVTGVSITGLGSIAASLADAKIDPTTTARIGASNVSAGGTLRVKAMHNEGSTRGAKAAAAATAGSLGIAGSGADADATSAARVYATVGGNGATLHSGAGMSVEAKANNYANADAGGAGFAFLGGIGISDSTALTDGGAEATIVDGSGSAASQHTTITGAGLSLDAFSHDLASATAFGAGGGLFAAGTAVSAVANISPRTVATIGTYTNVDVNNTIRVQASAATEGYALAEGYQGSAGITIGDSDARVNVGNVTGGAQDNGARLQVFATVADNAVLDASGVEVLALHNDPTRLAALKGLYGTDGITEAVGHSSGGGVAGLSFGHANIRIQTDVDATIGNADVTAGHHVTLTADSRADGASSGSSFQGGLGAFGTGEGKVTIAQDVDAIVGGGAAITSQGRVDIAARERSKVYGYAASAGGGAISTADADAYGTILSNADVTIGNGAEITAKGDVTITASQYFEGFLYSTSESYGAGASAYSTMSYSVNAGDAGAATAGVYFGQNATVHAGDTLAITADVDGGTISSHGFSQVGAAIGDADTDAITELHTSAVIDIATGAYLTGEDHADLLARHQGVYQDSGDYNGDTGLRAFGYSIGAGDTRFTYHLTQPTYVIGADGATLASHDVLVRTITDEPGYSVSADEDGTNLLDWEEFHGDWSPDRQMAWDADVVLLSGEVPELVVRSDGYIEKAVNVSVDDGGITKGEGQFITNPTFQVNNIVNDNPGHARFEANAVGNIFSGVEFADLGAWDGEAGTHVTSQIYGDDGTWYARRTFDTVTLVNHSTSKMIVNDISPIDRDGDPDGEAFINVSDRSPSGKEPFNFRIVNQFEPTLVTITSTSSNGNADVQFNGTIDNPIGATEVDGNSDILGDGSQLIRTNTITLDAVGDIGVLVGDVGAGGTRTPLRIDLVQSAGRPENLDAKAGGNIVLDLRGDRRDTGGGTFTVDIGTIDAGRNADIFLLPAVQNTTPVSNGSYALVIDENNDGGATGGTPAPTPYVQFFRPDPGSDPVYDFWKNLDAPLGVFGTGNVAIAAVYDFDLVQAGRITAGADIQINGQTGGASISIVANTNIFGGGSGVLYALTNGDITLTETTGDMRLGRVKSTTGDVTLVSTNADIIDEEDDDHLSTGNDATAQADVTGRNITMTAATGAIGEPCLLGGLIPVDFVEIDSSFSGSGVVTASALDDIYLDEVSGAMRLALVKSASGDVDLHTRAGAILDGNGAANNIEARTIDLVTVGGGVGASGDDVEIDTDNSTSATNGRLLVVATANGAGDASVYVTETDEGLDVLRATTDLGDIRLSVPDEADTGENFVLLAGGETLECQVLAEGRIQAQRDVTLRVGDNVDILSGTTDFILAGRNIDIYGDWGNADANVGTVMNLRGEITSDFSSPDNAKQVGERTRIFGHIDDDTFNFLQVKLGGDTYAYGSQNITAGGIADGFDLFFVDRLQSLTTVRGTYVDSHSNVLGVRDALTLDGQDQTDTYLVVTHGSLDGNGGLGGISDYIANALDTGAPDDGADTLTIKGSDDPDVFLLRGQNYIPGHANGGRPAFVALLHGDLQDDVLALGGDVAAQAANPGSPYLKVERVNYDQAMNGRLIVYGYGGDDTMAADDVTVIATLDGGAGNDRFQVGQLYRSEREYGAVADANDFAAGTVLTTRGYLSQGISAPVTIYGGTGNDAFSVYSNKAELRLEGNEGNDEFIVRAFALETGLGGDGKTLIAAGEGDDNIQYNVNAPVSIDGGPGFDRVVVLGTEFNDNFVVTEDGVFGAGLHVKMAGNEEMIEVDGLEGNDNFWVLGTPFDAATRIIGGLGSDDVNVTGDVTGVVVSRSLEGLSSTIDHQVMADPVTDPFYNNALAPGLDLNIATANAGKIVIAEPDGRTVVSESALLGSKTDFYDVYLAAAPGAAVYVTVSAVRSPQQEQDGLPPGDTFELSTDGVHFSRAIVLTFDAGEYGTAHSQRVYVRAIDDTRPEGARTAVISHSSISADAAFNGVAVRNVEADIVDDDKADIVVRESFSEYDNATQVLEGAAPFGFGDTYSVRLGTAPTGTTVVQMQFDAELGITTADSRYDAATRRITFGAGDWWKPVVFAVSATDDTDRENREIHPVTHTIYSSTDARYDDGNAATVEIAPAKLKVSVLDNDSEHVIVTESFGGTLVVQDQNLADGDQSVADTYIVRLSKAPVGTVTVTTVPLVRPDADGGMVQTVYTLPTALVFDATNWWIAQEVTVTANPDFDPAPGTEDYMYFPKATHTASDLYGPLEILGGVGPEDRSLAEAVLLPGETNAMASDGNVLSYTGSFVPGAIDTMVVQKADLQAVADAVPTDDVTTLQDLVGFTLQISAGPGLDRFWQINAVTDLGNGQVQLTLENPGRLEQHWNDDGAPTSASEYAVNALSPNFFVDEATQIDKVNVFNDGSVADDTGALTATQLTGLGMGPGVSFDTDEDNIPDLFFASGISYATYNDGDPATPDWYRDVEVMEVMLGRGNDTFTVGSTLQTTANHGGLTVVHGGGNTPVGGVMGGDTIIVEARAGGSPIVVFGDTSADGYRYSGQSGVASPNAMNFAFAGRDILDASAASESVTMYGGGNDDLILGSAAGDTLAGGSGDDRIFGLGGNDHVYGDSGVNIDVNSRKLVSGMSGPALQDVSFSPANPLVERTGHDRSQSYSQAQADDLTSTAVDLARPTWADSLDGGSDLLLGGLGNDIVFGDHGIITQFWPATVPAGVRVLGTGTGAFGTASERLMESRSNTNGKDDTIFGNEGDDILIGGAAGDNVDGNTGRDLVFGDNVRLDRSGHVGDATNPRFRVLGGTTLHDAADQAQVTSAWQVDPTGTPVWTDLRITPLDHSFADEMAGLNNFGDDYLAGGAQSDQIFGELGDDTIQGDGAIGSFTAGGGATLRAQLGAGTVTLTNYGGGRAAGPESRFQSDLTLQPSFEAATDGDDYVEGNGGNDVIFGNLGQDDLVGGSSTLFGLVTWQQRPDGDDLVFGGAGTEIARNEAGNVVDEGDASHSRDSDVIAGDNADVFRIRGVNGALGAPAGIAGSDGFLNFNYDVYADATLASARANVAGTDDRIIVRAVQPADYTPGGPDYKASALDDIGGADELHGESGDDFMYGMKGNDAMFGEGQDDDMIGGWGADWMSGGTGNDGLIGDDGRIYTSRNSAAYGEALNGISALLGSDPDTRRTNGGVLNELVYTPGSVQTAIINVGGDLHKAVNLTPFNADPAGATGGIQDPLFRPEHLNDVMFGGMGTDWLHGGAGDDAVSGSEALPVSYTQTWSDADPDAPVLTGTTRSDYARPYNNGDMLRFNPIDADGWHFDRTRRAGEFALYDEYDPLRKIELNADGTLDKSASGLEWFLNFDPTEPTNTATVTVGTTTMTKVDDALFGDLGNDWMMGGPGRDDMYGGYGNDLINADDDQRTHGELNDQPDTGVANEDRVYGGAGRDVLIANTGGDRLIDWVGEFNSYLVPFAPFGTATVSRTLQPQLPDYLYALSGSDGADPTRAADTGAAPERNGEPEGELGLNMPQDPDFHDQTGAPADPQAGNIPGGKRDVLRSASFNDGTAQGLMADSGTWQVSSGVLQVAASSLHGDAVAIYDIGDALPSYFEVTAAIKVIKPTAGWNANGYVVFDYASYQDFKFAGIDQSTNKLVIGHRDANGWVVDRQVNFQAKPDTYYNMLLSVNGSEATLVVNGTTAVSFAYGARVVDGVSYGLNYGLVGFGSNNSRGAMDNIAVQVLPPQGTFIRTEEFTTDAGALFAAADATGAWSVSGGRYAGAPTTGIAATSLMNLAGVTQLAANSALELSATLKASGQAGFVFDRYSASDFKFALVDVGAQQLIIGHHTADHGWVVDASLARSMAAGVDYSATLSIRGGKVTFTVNGTALVQNFNASAADGRFGLLVRSGIASFDKAGVLTDDPAFAAPAGQALTAIGTPDAAGADSVATVSAIQPLFEEALRRWATTEDAATVDAMRSVDFAIVDLPGQELALYEDGVIYIDIDAAGFGWYIDGTPRDDREFLAHSDTLLATFGSPVGQMDLLSVIMHELGHAAGLEHADGGVMDAYLAAGTRTAMHGATTPAGEAQATPTVRWDAGPIDLGYAADPAPQAPDWLEDFLQNIGRGAADRNPNAALRITVPTAEPRLR